MSLASAPEMPQSLLSRLLYPILLAGLLGYVALTIWLGLSGAFYPYQLDYGEGIVLWFARQAALGQPLYRPLFDPPLTPNNYPPVAMLLAAPFFLLFGPSYAPGRLLNLTAALLVAYLLYRMAQTETGARHWGLLAPLLFLGSTFIYHWVPLFRVDLLGLGLTFAGLYLVWRAEAYVKGTEGTDRSGRGPERLRADRNPRSLDSPVARRYWIAALALFLLAVYTKQSFLAAPAAATLALFVQDRRRGVLFGLAFGAAGALLFLTGNLLTGGGFWAGLITANASSWQWSTFWPVFSLWLRTYAVLLLIAAAVWVYRVRWQRKRGVLEIYLPLSLFSLLLSGRVGAWENYYFEAVAIICLFAVLAFRVRPRLPAYQPLLLLALVLQLGLYWPEHDPRIAANMMAAEGAANRALAPVLQAERGQVIAEDMGALVTAGQPVIYYTFVYSNLARSGQYNQAWELANLRAQSFPLVVLEQGTREDVDHYRRFSHEFLSELDATYAVAARLGKYELYRPAPPLTPAAFDFGGELDLVGWSRTPIAIDASTRNLVYILLWQAQTNPRDRYTTFVHLEDGQGGIVAQDDHEPRRGAFPTTNWEAGDKVREVHTLEWKSSLAPGTYSVRVGWYDPVTGDRLQVGDEDMITLEELSVGSR